MPANSELGRIPITIVELDQDQCSLVYGVAPCTAAIGVTGQIKCFNGYKTCQDRANYANQTLTLRFTKPHSDILFNEYVIPSLASVSSSATKLNIGGRSKTMTPLGRRAEISINIIDHPHNDNIVDPYLSERNYVAAEQGTFWGKWLARNPYYNGLALRVLDGYYGQTLAEMQTRHYIIDSISLPDSKSRVKIKAMDVLRLADDDKAQAPKITTGKLVADINATQTTLGLTAGNWADYSQNGTNIIRINDEIISWASITYLANGDVTLNGLTRALSGTGADSHEASDNAQACLQYSDQRPDAIAYDLLINYGNIPAQYIDLIEWQAEATTWLQSINGTRLLTEPMGVTKLLGQLCEEFSFYIWWNELERLIKFKAISPVFGSVRQITQDANLTLNSTTIKADTKQRISEVWISYLLKTPINKSNDSASYKRTLARLDLEASGQLQYGERKVHHINSPWLINESHANALALRLLSKHRDNSILIKFQLDAKDRDLDIADVFDIEFKGIVDETGKTKLSRYQVISKNEKVAGELIEIEAVKFDYNIDFMPGKWTDVNAPDYASATEAERFAGMWYLDENGKLGADDGYQWS